MAGESFPTCEAIRATQLEQLTRMLAAMALGNEFYKPRLRAAGLDQPLDKLSGFIGRCPFTLKSELVEDQRVNPPYGSNLTFALDRYTRFHQTSGTSGFPLRWLDTPESWDWMIGNWRAIYEAAGVIAHDRIFFAFSFGPFIGFWLAFESATQLGCLCLPGGGLGSEARLRVLLDNQVTVLCCTPTYALRLAEVAAEQSIDLGASNVRLIIVAGEPGGSIPSTRARLEALWPGAKVIDHHGMTETGPVSFQCPARPGTLHILEKSYLPEIIIPSTGAAAAPGEQGELVLTNLGRTGSPLLRYRTGDLVRASNAIALDGSMIVTSPCACGRHELALEGGIIGRVDDMVVIRGVNVYPSAIEEIVRQCGGIAEYRVSVSATTTLPELKIDIEPETGGENPDRLVAKLERAFSDALSLRIPIAVVKSGSLPRQEMKARRWTKSL